MSDYDHDAFDMLSPAEYAKLERVMQVADFCDLLAGPLAKTTAAPMPTTEPIDDGPRAPRPDRSQGAGRPLGGGEPADDLAAAMDQALGRYH